MFRFLTWTFITLIVLAAGVFLFMQQASFGKLPGGDRLSKIESSRNYRGGKFVNLVETSTMAEGVSYVSLMAEFFRKGVDREPISPVPSVKTDLGNISEGQVVWFGHSTLFARLGGKSILIDPMFSTRASPVQFAGSKSYPGTSAYTDSDFPDPDIILITHDHYDHLDYKTIVRIHSRTKLFCVPLGVGAHLEHWGVDPSKIVELDWWDEQTVGDIRIVSTPARHFSGRGFSRDRTLWSSYVVSGGGFRYFFGGDSGYDSAFHSIGEKFGPFDIAFLECGQYDVKWPTIHMMPEQTVQASIDLTARLLVPIHWGKFTLGLHPWKEPIERALAEAERLNVKVGTPMIGEPVHPASTIPSARWWDF